MERPRWGTHCNECAKGDLFAISQDMLHAGRSPSCRPGSQQRRALRPIGENR